MHCSPAASRILNQNSALVAESHPCSRDPDTSATLDFSARISFAVDGVILTDGLWPVHDQGNAAQVPLMIGANDSEFTMGSPEAQRALLAQFMQEEVFDAMTPFYGNEAQRDTFMYSDYVFQARRSSVPNRPLDRASRCAE